jgi:hypothetical protein
MLGVLVVVFLRRPYCHFAFQRAPALSNAHSFFASSESPLIQADVRVMSSDLPELQTGAQARPTFRCFAFFTL